MINSSEDVRMFTQTKEIKALDIEIETPFEGPGVAYYRLDQQMKEFLKKCEEQHGIAGFEYEVGSWNFGVILKHEKKG